MNKVADFSCSKGQKYHNFKHDVCRMCELRYDCPYNVDDFDPMPDCIEDESRY